MNPSSFGSSTFRDFGDIQKNLNKLLNKKNYVPNLAISRNAPNRPKAEENNTTKKEERKEKRKPNIERKVIPAVETFAPINESRSKIWKGRSKTTNVTVSSTNVKKEIFDKNSTIKTLAGNFEDVHASSSDLPASVPRRKIIAKDEKKSLSLLTEIMKEQDESNLFLLKTPKYLPAILDDSKCTIWDVPEGQIGKLQIMKSGRLRLVLGECKFWLHQGVKVNFKEELAVVKTDTENKTGEIINLGTVHERVIVVPTNLSQFSASL